MLGETVSDCRSPPLAIRLEKRLNKHGLFGRVVRRKPLHPRKEHGIKTQRWKVAPEEKNHKTPGTTSFGHTRPKWRSLAIIHSTMLGKNQTQHINCGTRWWTDDSLGLFCSHRTWATCSHSVYLVNICIWPSGQQRLLLKLVPLWVM